MYPSQTAPQIPARCLFPDSAASIKPSSPFSIGDIMKSVGLPVQDDVPAEGCNPQKDSGVPKIQSRLSVPGIQDGARYHQTTRAIGHQPQGLQLKDLLHNQHHDNPPIKTTSSVITETRNPFLSFLERPSLHDDTNRCRTPPLSVPLSLQHLKSCPEMSPGLPSTFKQLTSSTLLPTCPVLPSPASIKQEPVDNTSPTSDKSLSPKSDISEDLIDVESTSPNGSTTSSGFGSNPSPTPTSTASPPDVTNDIPANQRTAYNEKQSCRLKQVFQDNRYPDVELYEELSEELKIPIQRLRVWFQNRRARNKRRVPDPRMMNYPPHVTAMMSSAPGYGYMTPSPMMQQSLYQYPVSPASMYPMYPPNMYPGYSYPFQYQH